MRGDSDDQIATVGLPGKHRTANMGYGCRSRRYYYHGADMHITHPGCRDSPDEYHGKAHYDGAAVCGHVAESRRWFAHIA